MRKLTHEEILKERQTPEEAMEADRKPIYLIAHNIRSLYNVGSIFRTCDCALVSELILTGFTPSPPRKEIEKTALGAVDSVPWNYKEDIFEAINELKERRVKTIALELTDKKRRYDTFRREEYPLCLVLGNELTGLDDKIIRVCDDAVEIPMFGVKHSLNVAVAAGVGVFEALRKWQSFEE